MSHSVVSWSKPPAGIGNGSLSLPSFHMMPPLGSGITKRKLWLCGYRRPLHLSLCHWMATKRYANRRDHEKLGRGQQAGDLGTKAAVLSAPSFCVLVPDLCSIPGRDGIVVARGCYSRQKTNLGVRMGRGTPSSGSR